MQLASISFLQIFKVRPYLLFINFHTLYFAVEAFFSLSVFGDIVLDIVAAQTVDFLSQHYFNWNRYIVFIIMFEVFCFMAAPNRNTSVVWEWQILFHFESKLHNNNTKGNIGVILNASNNNWDRTPTNILKR